MKVVRLIRASFSFPLADQNNIRLKKELGEGALYDIGCYGVNTLHYFLGQPEQVSAQAVLYETGVDLTTTALLRYPGGIIGMVDCSFTITNRQSYEIVGTKGRIEVPYAYPPDKNGHKGIIHVYKADEEQTLVVEDDQYLNQVTHFSACILNGTTLSYTLQDTLENLRVMDEIYRQIRG
ncbi:Gfo/Idh/MocA family protein [Caldalkalibacillus thermarum]|uniref:Gfo/Idh/MocA family protein n=1 Tax=Caldalkalibacillus thermarum TaxID=296745 RepID=UPI0016655489|nr:Gfo/Idh/MocA family oxidoreductase [Caldalkalibacillus thermarum]